MQLTFAKMGVLMVWWLYSVEEQVIKVLLMIAGDSEGIGMVNGIGYKHLINKILNPQFVDTKYFFIKYFLALD